MDAISEKINRFLGVYPDDFRKRVSIAVIIAVIGAIFVMLGMLYAFSVFNTTLLFSAGQVHQTAYASQGIGMFLMFVYILFIGSLIYYVFLPWKPEQKNY